MTKSSRTLIISLIGAIVLATGAVYFGAPLFGWLIMIAIFAIYILTSWNISRGFANTAKEREQAKKYADLYNAGSAPSNAELEADGILNSRVRFLKDLAAKQVKVSVQDLPFLKSTWVSKEEVAVRSNGGVVVLLGLMGTFFGLMLSINAAGSAIDTNATSETTLGIIQNIFASMKGIFGSSLCGLFAALVLNTIHASYESDHENWIAELDEFTLFYLIPKARSAENEAANEIRHLIETVKASDESRAADFRSIVEASKTAEASRTASLAASLSSLEQAQKQNLLQLQQSLMENVSKASEKALLDLAQAQKSALEGMQTAVQKLSEEFAEALEQMGLARNSGYIYLTRLIKGGLVRRIRHGIYEKLMTEEEGES